MTLEDHSWNGGAGLRSVLNQLGWERAYGIGVLKLAGLVRPTERCSAELPGLVQRVPRVMFDSVRLMLGLNAVNPVIYVLYALVNNLGFVLFVQLLRDLQCVVFS